MKKENLEIKPKKKLNTKGKKNYFEIIFVTVSIFLFFVLVISIYFLKDALYVAKDEAASEFVEEYQDQKISESIDPFVASQGSTSTLDMEKPLDNGVDPAMGQERAKVKIFYFSDLSCSFCSKQEEIIKKVYDKFNQDVRIIWKDYPEMKSLNTFSYQAARAVRCANEQGKFWDYKRMLYQKEDYFAALKDQLFLGLAEELKLNVSNFESCLKSDRADKMIEENVKEAENLGVLGIPYIYVNDLDVVGSVDEEELENLVENELEK